MPATPPKKTPPKPATFFNKKTVMRELNALLTQDLTADILRKQAAQILNTAYKTGFTEISDTFLKTPHNGKQATQHYSTLIDQIIQAVFDFTLKTDPNPTAPKGLSLIAVGGYGRGEMAPYSDIDLLFLFADKKCQWTKTAIETMLYILWDLRIKLGYATRTIDECITLGANDQTIQTALLESRYLCGDTILADQLDTVFMKKLAVANQTTYVKEKLEERENRHHRHGRARYVLEPNIKEGKGGLRDLQALYWITKHLAQTKTAESMIAKGYLNRTEYERFETAHGFLLTVRCHLHLYAGRAAEHLTFDAQIHIARVLGYKDNQGQHGVESFMQDYFRTATLVGELSGLFLTALREQHIKVPRPLHKRLWETVAWRRGRSLRGINGYGAKRRDIIITDEEVFLKDPVNIMRIFEDSLRTDFIIHPDARRLIISNLHLIDETLHQSQEAQKIFLDLLLVYGNPEHALRLMNELGVLGAFIPEFGRIIAMMQFNIYHHYTVDEHTIQCISVLAKLESGDLKEDLPVVSGIIERGVQRRILYIAILLHDIGKGLPEDHSIAGARLARDICPRLGLDKAETDTVIWLVRNHLVMSDFAQKRDVSDPRTVQKFAEQVQDTNRLDLLTVLTVCDIRGVGPNCWNNWKAQLLRDLYRVTHTRLMGEDSTDTQGAERIKIAKDTLRQSLADWPAAQVETEMNRHYEPYWLELDAASHLTCARLLNDMGKESLLSHLEKDESRDATRACFVMHEHPGIFSRISGALALVKANIIYAHIYTTSDGFSIAIFWLQDTNGKPYQENHIKRLHPMIMKTLMGKVQAKKELTAKDKFKKRERDFKVATTITIDNEGSERYSIIEISTRDRRGLLFDLTKNLLAANIYIVHAVIVTYGVQAVDVFYVKDMVGKKIHDKAKQDAIATGLRAVLEQGTKGAIS